MELKSFVAQDDDGNVLNAALCHVYMRGTEMLVGGLQRPTGMPLSNPFNTDDLGQFQFAAPDGLYDLRVRKGLRDYRIPVQFKDADAHLAAAQNAALQAENARDAAYKGAAIFPTVADGLKDTALGHYFQVVDPDNVGFTILYRNESGAGVAWKRSPSTEAVDAITKVVKTTLSSQAGIEEPGVGLADEEGGQYLKITSDRTSTPAFEAYVDGNAVGIYDAEGAMFLHGDDQYLHVGPLMVGMTTLPGLYVTDEENGILQELSDPGEAPETLEPKLTEALAGGVFFAPKIVTAPNVPLHLDVSSMIAPREDDTGVVASISSHTTTESQTSTRELVVQAARFGSSARLKLRDRNNGLTHHIMDLAMTELPAGPFPGSAPNVLMIGDSISNRQGAQFLQQSLTAAGFTANFMGTFQGSIDAGNPNNMEGPLGECREGFSTGNYTYADMAEFNIPLEPGNEAAYLAMSKVQRRNSNPFIRKATESDPAAIIRNGYVVDFAFYQSRFSLPTPDIIVYGLGMNEFIRVTNSNDLYAYVLDNEKLMLERIRAAWPNVKIVRWLPGLPYNRTRNPQWTTRYVPMIRAVMANLNALNNPKNILVPSWTFANPETGYETGNDIIDPLTGISKVEVTDNTHPVGCNRLRLFQGIAPYIAAAKLDLI